MEILSQEVMSMSHDSLILKEILSSPVPVTSTNIYAVLPTAKILENKMKSCFQILPSPACIADIFRMNWIKLITLSKGTIQIYLGL